jgi:hypothetical protein
MTPAKRLRSLLTHPPASMRRKAITRACAGTGSLSLQRPAPPGRHRRGPPAGTRGRLCRRNGNLGSCRLSRRRRRSTPTAGRCRPVRRWRSGCPCRAACPRTWR